MAGVSPLIERDEQVAILGSLAATLESEGGKVVCVSGEVGIGKTRLLTEFAQGLPQCTSFAIGICDEMATGRPFGAFFDIAGNLGDEFGDAFSSAAGKLDPASALVETIRRSGRCHVLLFDDAQWADSGTLDLLAFMCRRIAELPVLVVIAACSHAAPAGHPLHRALAKCDPARLTTLELAKLSEAGIARLASSFATTSDGVFARSGGNPLLACALLGEPVERRDRVPAAVARSILGRLPAAHAAQREWLNILALFSDPVPPALLERIGDVFGLDPEAISLTCGILAEAADGSIGFRHPMLREAFVAVQRPTELRRLEEQILPVLLADPDLAATVQGPPRLSTSSPVPPIAATEGCRCAAEHDESRRGPYRVAREHPLGLTRREIDILRMIVAGRNNREIAEALNRSLRTVEHHVSAILGKMGMESRVQAALYAIAKPELLTVPAQAAR